MVVGGGRCNGCSRSRGGGCWSLVVGGGRCSDGSRWRCRCRFTRSLWPLVVVVDVDGGRCSCGSRNRSGGRGRWSLVMVVLVVVGGRCSDGSRCRGRGRGRFTRSPVRSLAVVVP